MSNNPIVAEFSIGFGGGAIGALLLAAGLLMLGRETRTRVIRAIDLTFGAIALVAAGFASVIAGMLAALFYLLWLKGIPAGLQKEALEMTVNIFAPLSIGTGAIGFLRAPETERTSLAMLLGALLAIGTFSGAMFKFYIENSITEPARVYIFIFLFFFCLTSFIVLPAAYFLDRFRKGRQERRTQKEVAHAADTEI